MAASTSSQFQYIQDDLYTCTRLMIDSLEAESLQSDFIQIELVQACALIAINELIRVGYRRAWMSAAKCFSFVVLMKLHNVDGQDSIATMLRQELSFAEIEERRRVFWMAYTLDRMISVLDQLPLTFDHHVVSEAGHGHARQLPLLLTAAVDSYPTALLRERLPVRQARTHRIHAQSPCRSSCGHAVYLYGINLSSHNLRPIALAPPAGHC